MQPSTAQPDEVIDVRPLGAALTSAATAPLFKTDGLRAVRLVVPAGQEIREHTAPGPLCIQCLEGRIAFTAMGRTRELSAGEMLYLPAREPHALRGVENSSALLTIALPPGT